MAAAVFKLAKTITTIQNRKPITEKAYALIK